MRETTRRSAPAGEAQHLPLTVQAPLPTSTNTAAARCCGPPVPIPCAVPSRRRLAWIFLVACAPAKAPTTAPLSPPPAPEVPVTDAAPADTPLARCRTNPTIEPQRDLDGFRSLAVSPDGRWITASGPRRWDTSSDQRTVLIDRASGVQIASLPGWSAVFTTDGRSLLVAYEQQVVRLSLPELAPVARYDAPTTVGRIAVDPDGRRLVGDGHDGAHVWDLASGERRCSTSGSGHDVAVSRDRIWSCPTGQLVEHRLDDCKPVRTWPLSRWSSCEIAVDTAGSRVVLRANGLLLLDGVGGAWLPHHVVGFGSLGTSLAALPDGNFLLAGEHLRRFEVHRPKPATRDLRLATPSSPVALAVSADGAFAVTYQVDTDSRETDHSPLWAWSLDPPKQLGRLGEYRFLDQPEAIAAHGETYLCGAGLCDTVTDAVRISRPLSALVYSGDGSRVFARSERLVRVHDGRTGAVLADIPDGPYYGQVTPSHDGRHALVVGDEGRLSQLLSVAANTPMCARTAKPMTSRVCSAATVRGCWSTTTA